MKWVKGAEGIAAAGHSGEDFAFDCEGPCHEVLLATHALASRPVSNGEWQELIAEDRKSTSAKSRHLCAYRMPSSALKKSTNTRKHHSDTLTSHSYNTNHI